MAYTTKDSYSFTVPLVPPSVNHYKHPNGKGGFYRSKEADAYLQAVQLFSNNRREPLDFRFYHVDLTFMIEQDKVLRCDLDNLLKLAFDALTHAFVIRDDRYVSSFAARKFGIQGRYNERTEFVVTRGKE